MIFDIYDDFLGDIWWLNSLGDSSCSSKGTTDYNLRMVIA